MEDDKKEESWWDKLTKSVNPLGQSITKSIKKRLEDEDDPKKKALKKLAE